jgi:formylglycine-generating enzyme required for sulfatase activity
MSSFNYFIEIPRGEAILGLDTERVKRLENEVKEVFEVLSPLYVSIRRFLLQVHPVTCAEYFVFLQCNPLIEFPPCIPRNQKLPESLAGRPVTGVTWQEARAYAKWIHARLPTEYEWEYAARTTDARPYPWGFTLDGRIRRLKRLPRVLRYPNLASPFGVQDMLGLVDEWTATRVRGWAVARGCPYNMQIFHAARRFLLKPNDRWLITGFRCAKSIK